MFDFKGQVVIVTGASGNLGSAVARAFLPNGAKLVLVDRATDRLAQIYSDIADSADHYLAGGVDLTNVESVKGMAEETVKRFGRIDVLVNTAGGYRAGTPLHETPLDTWDFMMNLNARTIFIACQSVIPQMIQQKSGKIVSVSARAALAGTSNHSAYNASKAAVVRLTESMAAELKGYNINVNCVLPGTIDTPQNREATPKADFGKWVSAESLADSIMFLASYAARDVHGAALPVYGQS